MRAMLSSRHVYNQEMHRTLVGTPVFLRSYAAVHPALNTYNAPSPPGSGAFPNGVVDQAACIRPPICLPDKTIALLELYEFCARVSFQSHSMPDILEST